MFTLQHIHPMLVHFPIAFILAGFFVEVISLFFQKEPLLSAAGFWLLIIGSLGSVTSYASGAFLTEELRGAAGSMQDTHELFAEITVVSALICTVFKIYLKTEGKEKSFLKWIALAIYAFTAITVSITGYYGGVLVYNFMLPR